LKDGFPSCLTWGITTFGHKHRPTTACDSRHRGKW